MNPCCCLGGIFSPAQPLPSRGRALLTALWHQYLQAWGGSRGGACPTRGACSFSPSQPTYFTGSLLHRPTVQVLRGAPQCSRRGSQ